MKKAGILFILLMTFSSVYAQSTKIVVEADKNLKADLSKYKTYQLAPQLLDNRNGIFFFNDVILKGNIIHAVEHELQARGYERKANNPDMIVNFRVFEKATQLTSFDDPQETYWGGTLVREPEDRQTYDVKAGTLLLNIADRKTGQLLWQGFASGIIDNFVFDRKKERVEEAVSLLFNEFKQRGDDLSKR